MNVTKQALAITTAMAGATLLAACSQTSGSAAGSRLPVYAADVTGAAKVCEVPKVSPIPGKTTALQIHASNEGGWCGVPVHQDGPKPFDAGLLSVRPEHGSVTVHSVGDNTRIDYTPDTGYVGSDAYTVTLLPGPTVLRITVSVTGPRPAGKPVS